MSFKFLCDYCGKELNANDSMIGQQLTCPRCRAKLNVPTASMIASSAAAAEEPSQDHHLLLIPSGKKEEENLIDMTAMVDIVFFLLIFFMVTSIQALQAVMELPPAQTSGASTSADVAPDYTTDPSFITVSIEADDTMWVEDEQVFGAQELRTKLRQLQKDDSQLSGMMVLGDPEASHGTLVTVLDAGADAGIEELRFSVSESLDAFGG
jgi:biopolymer transport protein ExbD